MPASREKSLKAQNLPWLWAVAGLDVLALLVMAGVETEELKSIRNIAQLIGLRASLTAAAPVIVLLLTSILPSDLKAVLVYWRLWQALPSYRAFSVHAEKDARIDISALRRNIGEFPTDARGQSSRWYKLYKAVESDVIVSTAHRHFLFFRDLAALSFVLTFLAPITLWLTDRSLVSLALSIFLGQYVLSALAARHEGTRMVTNVLALHSTMRHR